jgi:hypothetical protein
MILRSTLAALLISAGLFLPVQTAAQAKKTSYRQHKFKKYKAKKFKPAKWKGHKTAKSKYR